MGTIVTAELQPQYLQTEIILWLRLVQCHLNKSIQLNHYYICNTHWNMAGSDKIPIGIAQNSKLHFPVENPVSFNGTWWNALARSRVVLYRAFLKASNISVISGEGYCGVYKSIIIS
jgi:hypothetical protein